MQLTSTLMAASNTVALAQMLPFRDRNARDTYHKGLGTGVFSRITESAVVKIPSWLVMEYPALSFQ